MVANSDCLFCKIVDGSIPSDVVARSERALAFRDVNPQAPVHVLVIPTEHVVSLGAAADEHRDLLGDVLLLARDVAHSEGIAEGGFRVVLNTGDDGGQSVHHVHAHVLGGRRLSWPPG
jgi:histidine triad (HIT) family protein